MAFSCKNRALCPSCTARRMDDCAAALVDRVLPWCGYRQWVVTFPRRIRYHLAADPTLAAAALREVIRSLFAWQRATARALGLKPARAHANAAVTFVQRFNSALDLSLHFHILIPDAVFVPDLRAAPQAPRQAHWRRAGCPADDTAAGSHTVRASHAGSDRHSHDAPNPTAGRATDSCRAGRRHRPSFPRLASPRSSARRSRRSHTCSPPRLGHLAQAKSRP